MKLTKYDKQAFVEAVMNDVPEINYDGQINQLAQQYAYEHMPLAVRTVYDNNIWRTALDRKYTRGAHRSFHIYRMDDFKFLPEQETRLQELADKLSEQRATRNKLESKLTGIIAGCNTLKQATERLPEFIKYLPTDRDSTGVMNLPAISNVVAELTAAGWPKHQQPTQRVAA